MQTISRQIQIFVLLVVVSAIVTVLVFAPRVEWHHWRHLLLFYAMFVLASSVRLPDPRGGTITPTTVLTYLAIYLFAPQTALLVVGTGRTIGYVLSRGWTPWRAIVNGSSMGLSVALGAFAFQLSGGAPGNIDLARAPAAVIAGPLVHQVANNLFVAISLSKWRGTPLLSTWLSGVFDLLLPNLLSISTAVLLAILYSKVSHALILTYLLLLPFQWQALQLYVKRRQSYGQIVDGLVVATDVNFPLSRGHARRVADMAVAIAREMRLSETTVESIQFAALLHDVGMIGKDDLLDQPSMTTEDISGLQDHVRVGAEIAKELPRREIANLILRHHERFDGTGYPGGLRGEAIPLGARIIGLAEAVDSMISGTFPHSSRTESDLVRAHVIAERERGYDPAVVDAFLNVVDGGIISLRPGVAADDIRDTATSAGRATAT